MTEPTSAELPQPTWEECMELLERLPEMGLDERAVAMETLIRNSSPGIRQRALRVGVAILPDETLVEYVRSEGDAVLRNAGLEMLKARAARSLPVALELLRDDESKVVIQAVLILDHLKNPRALDPLRAVLGHSDPNVVQAAIVAIGHLGDARAIPDLLPFLEADAWLQMAAVQALGDLRSPAAVEPLSELLTDLMLGALAAEALAQIGGDEAARALAGHWLRFRAELEPEAALGLLAHALEGLPRRLEPIPELRKSLAERLRDPYREVRVCAARCLLALGPGVEDSEALSILESGTDEELNVLPSCLAQRADLAGLLLAKPGLLRSWGLKLTARHPRSASVEALAGAVSEFTADESLEPLKEVLLKIADRELAGSLLNLYLRLTPELRAELAPVIEAHREGLETALADSDMPPGDRIVLGGLLGEGVETLREGLLALDGEDRAAAIEQLTGRADVLASLPWDQWLAEDGESTLLLAAHVADEAGLRELLPLLREAFRETGNPAVVRAFGSLGDREAVPLLLDDLDGGRLPKPLLVESLGRIGGPEARAALRELAGSGQEKISRLAYRALAACATEEDDTFFREAITHADWYVRLACTEVLGRFVRPENLAGLSRLAADPVPVVAQRALESLEG